MSASDTMGALVLSRGWLLVAALSAALLACSGGDASPSPSPSPTGVPAGGASSCPEGFAECDGDEKTVCETSLSSSVSSCGACGKACSAGPSQIASCSSGSCKAACSAGFADCNGEASDGCEVDLSSDRDHCGGCDRACAGSSCHGGTCGVETLVAGLAAPYALALDGDSLYVSLNGTTPAYDDGAIARVPTKGGEAIVLSAGERKPLGQLAFDASYVYYTTRDPDDETKGALKRVPKAGGAPTTIFEGSSPGDVAVDETQVYWTSGIGEAPGVVYRADLATLTPSPMAMGFKRPLTLVVDQGFVWFVAANDMPYDNGGIYRVPTSGGAFEQIYDGVAKPGYAMDRDADNLYVQSFNLGTLSAYPKAGGSPRLVATGNPRGFVVDGESVFYTVSQTGEVFEASLSGGEPLLVAKGQVHPQDIVVDGRYVYWAEQGDVTGKNGAVRRVAR